VASKRRTVVSRSSTGFYYTRYAGTIARVDATPQASIISVEPDSGRTVIFDPAKYNHLDWGWASTTFKAQDADDPTVFASIAPPTQRDLRMLR
jgi:ATP-dependent exoDNAse (exonuclease V) alpha subunit